MKSLRHQVFPGGPPSKYYPGPTMLNFRDQTRTGVFIVVWSQAMDSELNSQTLQDTYVKRMLQLYKWRARWSTPQGQKYHNPGRLSKSSSKLQIKNIKLHIVTDIKVNFNSMLGFRISLFGWGAGHYNILKKYRHMKTMTFQAFVMANQAVITDNS